jgi:hypothetical protein
VVVQPLAKAKKLAPTIELLWTTQICSFGEVQQDVNSASAHMRWQAAREHVISRAGRK